MITPKAPFPASAKVSTYGMHLALGPKGENVTVSNDTRLYRITRGKKEKAIEIKTEVSIDQHVNLRDGRIIAIFNYEKSLGLFDADGNLLREFEVKGGDSNESFLSVAVSADESIIAATRGRLWGSSKQIMAWKVDGSCIRTLTHEALNYLETGITFLPNSSTLICFMGGCLCTFRIDSDECECIEAGYGGTVSRMTVVKDKIFAAGKHQWALFTRDGERIASCCAEYDDKIHQYRRTYDDELKEMGGVEVAELLPDGETILEGCEKTLTLRSVKSREVLGIIQRKRRTEVRDMVCTDDGWIAIGVDGAVEFYHLSQMEHPSSIKGPDPDPDLEKIGDGDEWRIKGPKGELSLKYVELSKQAEEESKHARISSEVHVNISNKWERFMEAYSHGSYDGADVILLEDGAIHEKVIKRVCKHLGSKFETFDVVLFLAKSTPYPEAYVQLIEG